MKVHEYQAKAILRDRGVSVPRGVACFSVNDAVNAAQELSGDRWVVKAQIHAGGRGKGGGVKVVESVNEVEETAGQLLGMQLVTHQTDANGQQVKRLLVEEGVGIDRELYLGLVIDRATQKVVIMASAEGGTEIEEVAAATPDKIFKLFIDPGQGVIDTDV